MKQVRSTSLRFNLICQLNLSKFRVETGYHVQDDSLLSIIRRLNFDFDLAQNLNENCKLTKEANSVSSSSNTSNNASKYLLLIEEFLERYLSEMIATLARCDDENFADVSPFNNEDALFLFRNSMHLFEKFYLICACTFDPVLTLPYLKYYWSFLNSSLKSIQDIFFK